MARPKKGELASLRNCRKKYSCHFLFRPTLSKKSSVGMRLCNSLNWNSISLAGFLLTRIIIIAVIFMYRRTARK